MFFYSEERLLSVKLFIIPRYPLLNCAELLPRFIRGLHLCVADVVTSSRTHGLLNQFLLLCIRTIVFVIPNVFLVIINFVPSRMLVFYSSVRYIFRTSIRRSTWRFLSFKEWTLYLHASQITSLFITPTSWFWQVAIPTVSIKLVLQFWEAWLLSYFIVLLRN